MCYVRFSLHLRIPVTICVNFYYSNDLTLPTEHSSLQRKNFVYRMLFKDIY